MFVMSKRNQLSAIVLSGFCALASAQDAATPAPEKTSQDIYLGLGLPALVTLGYSHSLNDTFGVRAEYGGGLNTSQDGTNNGVSVTGTFRSNRAGVFLDWFPFGGTFRFVGGATSNDMKVELDAVSSGTTTINGKPVNMSGQYFNVAIKYPTATPYLGVGWGHQNRSSKGLGFYSDIGIMIGQVTADVNTSLVGQQGITQADIDAQTQQMRDSVSKINMIPSFSVGMTYSF